MAETFYDDVESFGTSILEGVGDVGRGLAGALEPFATDAGQLASSVQAIRGAFSSGGGSSSGGRSANVNARKLRRQRRKAKARADALAMQVGELEALIEQGGRTEASERLASGGGVGLVPLLLIVGGTALVVWLVAR